MSKTAVASKELAVRDALLAYLLIMKEFYSKLYSPTIISKMETLLPIEQIGQSEEPIFIRLARAEKWWLNQLISSLSTIDRMLTNIEQWQTWFLELVENLDFTEDNIKILTQGKDDILEHLKSHKLDEGYIRLVVNNATNDFLDYVKETRQLLDRLVEMDSFIKGLESPLLQIVELRLNRVKKVNYQKLLSQMRQLLAATYNAPTKNDFLRNLSGLLDIFSGWRGMLQLDDSTIEDLKTLDQFVKDARKSVNELNELTRNFQKFIEARRQADYYNQQAILSIIRMMLSYEGIAEKWWLEYIQTDPVEVSGFIPERLDANQLLIGVTHSLALLEDLEQRLLPQMPSLKTTVGKLGEYLQSPSVELYQDINQSRIALWEDYEKQMVSLLIRLRTELHELIRQQNRPPSHQ